MFLIFSCYDAALKISVNTRQTPSIPPQLFWPLCQELVTGSEGGVCGTERKGRPADARSGAGQYSLKHTNTITWAMYKTCSISFMVCKYELWARLLPHLAINCYQYRKLHLSPESQQETVCSCSTLIRDTDWKANDQTQLQTKLTTSSEWVQLQRQEGNSTTAASNSLQQWRWVWA